MGSFRFFIGFAVLFTMGSGVMAAEFLCPMEGGAGAALTVNRPVTNLYAAGSTVAVTIPVKGDLTAAGGQVEILGKVERDLTAVGGDLQVGERVGANARLVGGRILVNGIVGEDLIAAGGRLTVAAAGSVNGDAALAGGEIELEGPVRGKAWIGGGKVVLNGPIGGKAVVHYDQSLTLGPSCRLSGKLECYGPKPPLSQTGSIAPSIDFHATPASGNSASRFTRFFGVFGLWELLRFAAWVLAAWILTRITGKPLKAVLGVIQTNPWHDLGLGFLILLVSAVTIPVLFLTGVGYYTALVGAGVFGTGLLLARLLAGFYLGILLKKLWVKGVLETSVPFRWTVAGLLALDLLGAVPFLGWMVSLGLSLLALGAMSRLAYQSAVLEKLG